MGIVIFNDSAKLYFVEAKKGNLTLRDLGQLLIYCKLCNPEDAWLLTPAGLGTLVKLLENQNREDLLDYGNGKHIKKIKISRWIIERNMPDYNKIIPRM